MCTFIELPFFMKKVSHIVFKIDSTTATTTTSNRACKRTISDEFEFGNDAKKIMSHHQSCENQSTATIPKPVDQPRFVSAATVIGCTPKTIKTLAEMTDDEIIAYTIEFEKKHPQ